MSDLDQRIEAMHRQDVRGAWLLIVCLWVTILFVLIMTWPFIPLGGIRVAVVVAAAVVLVFNTAAIRAMVAHYAEDKHFIYGLDIQHLDAAKRDKL